MGDLVTFEVHLTLARPCAEIELYGDLGAEAVATLHDAVESARIAGCRRIALHLGSAGSADETFIRALGQLRRECTRGGGSFDVTGLVLLSSTATHTPRLRLVPTAVAGQAH